MTSTLRPVDRLTPGDLAALAGLEQRVLAALHLYTSTGFRSVGSEDYYRLT